MKKLISLALALCLALALVPAMADADVTGDWYGSMLGVAVTMTLNADGTGAMTVPGQGEVAATWTLEGDQITITAADSPATGTVTEDSITLSQGGMEIVFGREPIEAITVAEVKPDAAVEEFYGEWAVTYLESEGMILDPSALGAMFPNLVLGEGKVEFIPGYEDDFMAAMYNMLGLAGSYADGVLTLTSTAEGANASGKAEILQDGMLKLSLDTDDGSILVMYYSPVAAEETPAA